MSKKKIIITYDADLNATVVVDCVRQVVEKGKISEGRKDVPQYCFATTFTNDMIVIARDKRGPDSADSFLVRKEKQ